MQKLGLETSLLAQALADQDANFFLPLLITDSSPEAVAAEKLLNSNRIQFRTTCVGAEDETGPTLATDLGVFFGLRRIEGFVKSEKSGFNAYARRLLRSKQ